MNEFPNAEKTSKLSSERIPKFVKTIYDMIEDQRYQDHVSWSQDGCAMLIKKPIEFAENVLPIFFKHNNFSSFVRQLNLYSFRKKKRYPYDNAFVHNMFRKGQRGLLIYIKRKGNEKSEDLGLDDSKFAGAGAAGADNSEEHPAHEELNRQNCKLKKIHQELTEYVQQIEEKADSINKSNEILQLNYNKKAQDGELLKTVLKRLGNKLGEDAIKSAFHTVVSQDKGAQVVETRQTISRDTNFTINNSKLRVQLGISTQPDRSSEIMNKAKRLQDSLILSELTKSLLADKDDSPVPPVKKTLPPINEPENMADLADYKGLMPKKDLSIGINWSLFNGITLDEGNGAFFDGFNVLRTDSL